MTEVAKAGSSNQQGPELSHDQIVGAVNGMRESLTNLQGRIGQMEAELHEHEVVLAELNQIEDKTRKCYRMVGSVLTERTVIDVIPAVTKNREGIKSVLDQMVADLKNKESQMVSFMKEHNVQFQR